MSYFDSGYDSFFCGGERPPFDGEFQHGWDAAEQENIDDQERALQIYIAEQYLFEDGDNT